MRIIQISDTHLSPRHRHFAENAEAMRAWLAAEQADLIVNTGDLSMNGAIDADDMAFAADWHRALGVPFLAVPGNHDVGDVATIRADQVVNDERLARFRDEVADDRWTLDIPGWRLIGLNAMLYGTGHREEAEQFEWLRGAVETTSKVALFQHKPMFIEAADEGPRGYWTVTPEPRKILLDILRKADVQLVSSGHLHIAKKVQHGPVEHLWSPSSAFVCGDSQEDLGGSRRIGAVILEFDADGVVSRFERPAAVADLQIDPHMDAIYPRSQAVA